MSHLILELHAGEAMIVNGASLRFRTRSRVELTTQARFLFGKQIMAPEGADSPARRIYFALQTAYIGNEAERADGVAQARAAIRAFQGATTSGLARDILDRTLALVEADECYAALKLARRIMRHEDSVLSRAPEPVRPVPSLGPQAGARPEAQAEILAGAPARAQAGAPAGMPPGVHRGEHAGARCGLHAGVRADAPAGTHGGAYPSTRSASASDGPAP